PPTVRILPGDGEGEVATLRVIQADRDLSSLAVAYDPEDQTLWMAAEDRGVLIFDATAPLSEPIAVLPAGQEGGFVSADEVVFDLAHREAWLSDTTTDTLYIHSMDEPTMPALRTLGGPNTTLDQATTLLFDPTRDEVIVANYGQGQALIVRPQIVSFPRDAQGNVAPIRTLAAPQILNNPIGLALDPTGERLYVGDAQGGSIQIYAWPHDGMATPLRTIELEAELGKIALDPINRELLVVNGHLLQTYPLDTEGSEPLRSIDVRARTAMFPYGLTMCDGLQ
ncbi:MAG: hypothetical protein AAFX99_34335, partial [Myxococcota bacterium]